MNQLIVGPLVRYERIVTDSLLLVTSESFHYSTEQVVWAHIAGGVPVSATKILWQLESHTDRDAFIFAIEDWNDQAGEKHSATEIKAYARETDSMRSISRKRSMRMEMGPRANPST